MYASNRQITSVIKKIPLEFKWLQFFKCELDDGVDKAVGYGHSFLSRRAARKAHSEAWERLYFQKLKTKNLQVTSTNGFAAHSNTKEAIEISQQELLERYILLKAWSEKKGWRSYQSTSTFSRVLELQFARKGWKVKFYSIYAQTDKSMFCILTALAQNEKHGTVFDCAFLNYKKPKSIELKILQSLAKNICYIETFPPDPNFNFKNSTEPTSHSEFYRDPKNNEAFAFLEQDSAEVLNIDHYDKIESEILHDLPNSPKVVRSSNTFWPKLTWGINSISGINPYPHPLA
jgi:hypothetical protein